MLRQALAGAVATAALAGFAFPVGSVAAQTAVETFSNFAWRDISQQACLARASQSMTLTLPALGVTAAEIAANSIRILGRTDDLNAFVYCLADDETAALDGPNARRVLVAIYVSTSRGQVGADIRDQLAACMETGACPAMGANTPPTVRPKP